MTISFLTPILLAGAALSAIPILIHLIMRRQPKHMVFPAFRFLKQRQRTTVQKLRLRHLLLLTLRVLLILAAVLALAQPELSGGPDGINAESAIGVVMVFDTSASMGYVHNDLSRLAEAKEHAERFLKQLPEGSKIAIFDTGESGTQIIEPGEAVNRVRSLNLQPYNREVTQSLREVLQFLERDFIQQQSGDRSISITSLPLVLCIFSDRTEASWNQEDAGQLAPAWRSLEEKLGAPVTAVYLDLGRENPRNLAIIGVSVKQVQGDVTREIRVENLEYGVARGQPIQLQAHLRVTGMKLSGAKLILLVNGVEFDSQTLQIDVPPGESRTTTVTFTNPLRPENQDYQGEVRLQVNDALKADDVRYWTLSVPERRVLLITDREGDAFYWDAALTAQSRAKLMPMETRVLTPDRLPEQLSPDEYQTICLINVAAPDDALWKKLYDFVAGGGGLIVLPGDNTDPVRYKTDVALQLMPARLEAIKDLVQRARFAPQRSYHEIVEQFRRWELPLGADQIRTWRLWEVDPIDKEIAEVVLYYDVDDRPAIIERRFDPSAMRGKVLLFTSAMYFREPAPGEAARYWNNYLQSPVYLSLVYASTRYVLGAREEQQNYQLKDELRFALPRTGGVDAYLLSGPDGGGGPIDPTLRELILTEGRLPGNYKLGEPAATKTRKSWGRYFSINLPAQETQLSEPRPSVEAIEAVLGSGAVAPLENAAAFRDTVRFRLGQTPKLNLLPYLMVFALLVLVGEGLLANRFYRPDAEEGTASKS